MDVVDLARSASIFALGAAWWETQSRVSRGAPRRRQYPWEAPAAPGVRELEIDEEAAPASDVAEPEAAEAVQETPGRFRWREEASLE